MKTYSKSYLYLAMCTALALSTAPSYANAYAGKPQESVTEQEEQKLSEVEKKKRARKAEQDAKVERIAITGTRSSIKESLFVKKNAIGVVDAIVAEDIGKFPDQNIAEALQRMTGITITRNGGEGQNVVVRGLGGDYNVTTINGRRMASEHSSRDFNYDLIASELLSSVEVYKSPESRNIEGGIGSVINIKTRRPLDFDGLTVSGSVKGIYEDRTEKFNPQASFLVSDTFNDNTFGALFTMVYSERTLRSDSYEGEGFFDPEEDINFVKVPVDTNGDGEINGDEQSFESIIPGYVRYSNWQDTRERVGASLALQWRPSDDVEVNFDSLYSSYDTDGSQYQISFVTYDESWTPGIPSVGDVKFNDAGRVNYVELVDGAMAELLNVSTPRNTETYQVGLNTNWYVNNELTFTADISHSSSEAKNAGDNRYIVARGFVDSIIIDQTSNNLLPDVTMTPALSEKQPFGAHYSYNYGTNVKDEVSEFKLSGKYQPNDGLFSSVDFGLDYGKQTKGRTVYGSKNPSQFSNGGAYFKNSAYPSFDNSSVETLGGLDLFRLPSDILVPANFDNFLAGEPGNHPAPWASFDYDKLYAFYQTINAQAADEKIKATLRPKDTYEVSEETLAAYIQANIEGEISDKPYTFNAGLRVIQTSVATSGYSLDISKVKITKNDKGDLIIKDLENYYTGAAHDGDYTDVLPSFNFKLNVSDELVYRLSGAKVLTRPNLGYLSPYSSINLKEFKYNASNPSLSPLRANQLDTTLEWYYSEYGALTAALYFKDIESFITNGRLGTVNIDGYDMEYLGPKNGDYGATIKGAELAYQQSFDEILPAPFDGFGVQVNYTYVDSSYDDPDLKAAGLPFEGMSKNSYNAVIYYEKDGAQARIAYNWRGKFLQYADAWGGPSWGADYGQFDFSSGYDLTDNISLNLSITNLTNERHWGYIKREEQVNHLSRYGRTINFGITAKL